MLNPVPNLFQYWFSISLCPEGEILKRVQDDKSYKFQIRLVRNKSVMRPFYLGLIERLNKPKVRYPAVGGVAAIRHGAPWRTASGAWRK